MIFGAFSAMLVAEAIALKESKRLKLKEKTMNSDKRMAELYLGQSEGKHYLWRRYAGVDWRERSKITNPTMAFNVDAEYKLKPETLEEAIERAADEYSQYVPSLIKGIFEKGAKWAWANPESKE